MMSVLREWGFPVGLLLVWTIAAAFTLHALIGMQSTLQSTQVPPQSMQVVRQPAAAGAVNAAPAS
jgi:hypothetical protein